MSVKTVGIFSKPHAAGAHELVPRLIGWLAEREVAVRLDLETANYAGEPETGFEREFVPEGCDLAIVLGGDGTLLSAARAVSSRGIPVLAVNLGGLGFLTSIPVGDLFPTLERAIIGPHKFASRRRMLTVIHRRSGETLASMRALNDVVIAGTAIARIVDLEAWARR